jgi:hypothetical protein
MSLETKLNSRLKLLIEEHLAGPYWVGVNEGTYSAIVKSRKIKKPWVAKTADGAYDHGNPTYLFEILIPPNSLGAEGYEFLWLDDEEIPKHADSNPEKGFYKNVDIKKRKTEWPSHPIHPKILDYISKHGVHEEDNILSKLYLKYMHDPNYCALRILRDVNISEMTGIYKMINGYVNEIIKPGSLNLGQQIWTEPARIQ